MLQNEFQKLKEDANTIGRKIEISKTYGKSQHPGIQSLNPPEWLRYAEMHMRHHLKQKSRIDAFLKLLPLFSKTLVLCCLREFSTICSNLFFPYFCRSLL